MRVPSDASTSKDKRDELLKEIEIVYSYLPKEMGIEKFSNEELKLMIFTGYVRILRYMIMVKTFKFLGNGYYSNESEVDVNPEFNVSRKYYIIYQKGILKPKIYFTTNENYKSDSKFKLYGSLTLTLNFATKAWINGKKYIIDPNANYTIEYLPDDILSLISKIPKSDFIDKNLLNERFMEGAINLERR